MSQVRMQAAGYHFDDFFLDAANRQLLRENRLVPLNSKYFDVLLLLVSQCGLLVEKQRIFDEIWKGVFVTDAALTQCIKDIRKQLGDDAANPRYIKTIPKHGYIFVGKAVAAHSQEQAQSPSAISESNQALQEMTVQDQRILVSRPYKFLDYFTEQDRHLFFGRETEVELIGSQILARRSFILHGRSGVGKSSIIRAGVMPRLKSQEQLTFAIRSFTDPLGEMLEELAAALHLNVSASSDQATSQAEALEQAELVKHYVLEATKDAPQRFVIFFLDQFEEFFTLLEETVCQRFIAAVNLLFASPALPVKLVFVLREDFLAEMSQFKSAIPEIFHHEYRLRRLSREQAARAIIEPALAVGCQYEPQLMARLLDDLSDQESVDPPQLQIVCDRLFDTKDEQGHLTIAAYEELGTASQILAGYLERVLRRFNAAELQTARAILMALISADGRRLVLPAAKVTSRLGHRFQQLSPENRPDRVIDELIAARIVRRRYHEGEAWLELAHDFLTPEVSRWLTQDERALMQARSVLERAMENFNIHQLLIDVDALDVLLPFGNQLGLTGKEADLLATSLMNRARPVPEWLAGNAPSLAPLIEDAAKQPDFAIRLCAIEACQYRRDEKAKELLQYLSLWDNELAVRKAASIALADWFQTEVATILSDEAMPANRKKAGTIRRAISLAMIRDYDRRLIWLPRLPLIVSLLVVGGLMWVRLLRGGQAILRQGIGGTLGASLSGLAGGVMLGLALALARQTPAIEAVSLMVVIISLGAFIGGIGGTGVSFGMVAASHITYRHSRWWAVIGAAAGGATVGGITNLLGVDIIRAVFGQNPSGITGALEGAVIGAGLSLGTVLTTKLVKDARPFQRVVGASLGAMCAGIVLTVIGGNLFSGSLEVVARSFADSQIRLEPLAPYFGTSSLNHKREIIFGAIEGLMFGAGLMSGIEFFSRRQKNEGLDSVSPH